jgi:hypothetical protein
MGVAIAAKGDLMGEAFLARDHEHPSFDADDLDLGRELAALFAIRLHISRGVC